jgi:hypothetical protein
MLRILAVPVGLESAFWRAPRGCPHGRRRPILAVRAGETPVRWAARCCGASSEDLPGGTSLPASFGSPIARTGEPVRAWLSSDGTPGRGEHRARIARMRTSASALPGPGLELPPTRGHARLVSGDRSQLEPGNRALDERTGFSLHPRCKQLRSRSSPFRPCGWAFARLQGGLRLVRRLRLPGAVAWASQREIPARVAVVEAARMRRGLLAPSGEPLASRRTLARKHRKWVGFRALLR